MITTNYHNQVAVLTLDRGVTNALNLELLRELAETLRDLMQAPDVSGIVLTSSNHKFFSIGFDLPQLIGLERKEFEIFFRTFNRTCMDLYTLPKPTVAAITGHAIAGGCILALCCDYRFCADGRKLMGLNEIKLGVPVPYLADCVLHQIVGARNAREIMCTGEFYEVDDSYRMGLIDRVVPLEHVIREAIEKADSIGRLPGNAFAAIKSNRVEAIERRVSAKLEEKVRLFMECWVSEEARTLLREATEKF